VIRSGAFWRRHSCHPPGPGGVRFESFGRRQAGSRQAVGQEPTATVSAPPPLSVRTGKMTQLSAIPAQVAKPGVDERGTGAVSHADIIPSTMTLPESRCGP